MRVIYESKTYSFDLEEIEVDQLDDVESVTGLTLKTLEESAAEGDLKALRVLFWLMLAQNGQPGNKEDILTTNFKPVKFARALSRAQVLEAKQAKPNPTQASRKRAHSS